MNVTSFTQMLFYQVTSCKCNFDILVMQNAETFLQRELEFFANDTFDEIHRTPHKRLRG